MARTLSFLLVLLIFSPPAWADPSPFRVEAPEEPVAVERGQTGAVSFLLKIPPGHFVYKEKTEIRFVDPKGFRLKEIVWPQANLRVDPFFKKEQEVFEGPTAIQVLLDIPKNLPPEGETLETLVTLQGCSSVLCYPLETHLKLIAFRPGGGWAFPAAPPEREKIAWSRVFATGDFGEILLHGAWMMLLIVFLGGVLTSLTPCVLPVIPITLMVIGVRAEAPLRRNFFVSLALVFGLCLTYAALGLAAVALGKTFGFVFQNRWFLVFLSFLFFALSLSMFGLYEIHLPHFLRARINRIQGHGLLGAFLSGIASGFLAAPCAGPVILALLAYVAATQNYLQGFGLLFIFGLGMGLLFLVLGTGYGTLVGRFRGGAFTLWVKRGLGVLLLVGALFYFNAVVPIHDQIISWFRPAAGVSWYSDETEAFRSARREGKTVMIDFYADWCAPCKELEFGFFREPETAALLGEVIPLRMDATFMEDPKVAAAVKKYDVIGWPTVVFAAPDGTVLKDLQVVAYNPGLLLENLKKAAGRRFPPAGGRAGSLPPPSVPEAEEGRRESGTETRIP